jgi:hypothetical protein
MNYTIPIPEISRNIYKKPVLVFGPSPYAAG